MPRRGVATFKPHAKLLTLRLTNGDNPWAKLEAAGKMIGYYVLIVAATALERGSDVTTFNRKHSDLATGLNVVEPM